MFIKICKIISWGIKMASKKVWVLKSLTKLSWGTLMESYLNKLMIDLYIMVYFIVLSSVRKRGWGGRKIAGKTWCGLQPWRFDPRRLLNRKGFRTHRDCRFGIGNWLFFNKLVIYWLKHIRLTRKTIEIAKKKERRL